ncbi:putative retrotransposon hot spot protein 4 (RHS4) [Trypanosoma vivax]|nr:putative retrotransposon hot spot protein 4 (RHS4) [Trypanosoma vivax]
MVLYRKYCDNYPVIDGFFVVEGHPDQAGRVGEERGVVQRTAVLLVTLAAEHYTETNKLMLLKKALHAQFTNWEDFTRDAQ